MEFVETISLTRESYDKLNQIISEYEKDFEILQADIDEFKREKCENMKLIKALKEYLLSKSFDDYYFKNYELKRLLDANEWCFGIRNKEKMLEYFSLEELQKAIKKHYEEVQKELEQEGEENNG